MIGGSLLKQKLVSGIEQVWQIDSIELGAEGEIGVIRMHCLTERNTIDGHPIEVAAPSNMVTAMISAEVLELYDRVWIKDSDPSDKGDKYA